MKVDARMVVVVIAIAMNERGAPIISIRIQMILQGHNLALDKATGGFNNQLLFISKAEIHIDLSVWG